jgi:hypothetical protein
MRLDRLTAEGKTKSASRILTAVQALERLKNAIPVLRFNAGTVIGHAEKPVDVVFRDRYMYLAILPVRVSLSIIEQMAKDFGQLLRVAMERGKRVVRDNNFRASLLDGLPEDIIHINAQKITALGRGCYAIHHAADQRLNSRSPFANVTAVLIRFRVPGPGVPAGEQFAVRCHSSQRFAQIVRGGEDKIVKLLLNMVEAIFGIQTLLNLGAERCL